MHRRSGLDCINSKQNQTVFRSTNRPLQNTWQLGMRGSSSPCILLTHTGFKNIHKYVTTKEVHVRFCKRRGADGFFSIPHLLQFATFTFHLFWVNTPLCQGRAALHCSKIERQISHENECFEFFFFIFVIFFIIGTFFINNLYT